MVCMHATESDDRCALHRGTRVRKNHTSRRDAFETLGAQPLGYVDYDAAGDAGGDDASGAAGVEFTKSYEERGATNLALDTDLESDVELVKFTPGMDPAFFEACEGKAGVVVEGTGLGHVHTDFVETIEGLVDDGTTVVMTSQCLEGRVCDRVYDTGRDLLDAGVVEGEDMLPGTAKVKLMWALANTESVAETMRTPIAGEITERSAPWE
jgi:glutamyl-tRNA(Gln) amidotransferase subunit D